VRQRFVVRPAAPTAPCTGDVNGDSEVNGFDLGAVVGAWGASGGPADVNGDGSVDGQDLGVVLGGWGRCAN
jgi:hypothetical protein